MNGEILRKKTPYPEIQRPGHPMASSRGRVAAHRAVLYDAIGPGPHPCKYCGRELNWYRGLSAGHFPDDYLVVDHKDGWSLNFDLSNLVPSCAPCNNRRGAKNQEQWNKLRTFEIPKEIPTSRYKRLKRKGHPLATSNGHLAEHRAVLFAKLGPGNHPCHWCGRVLRWTKGIIKVDSIIPDHVDNISRNNDPSNVVAACPRCNCNRQPRFSLNPDEVWGIRRNGKRFRAKMIPCAWCGTPSPRPLWDLHREVPRYCSKQCKMRAYNKFRNS